MNCRIIHRTVYNYSEPVTVSHHAARLEPMRTLHQRGEEFSLQVVPEPAIRKNRRDYYGNLVCFFSVQEIHSRLEVTASSRVSIAAGTPPAPNLSAPWERVAELFTDPVSPDVVQPYEFVFNSPMLSVSPALADYARESFPAGAPLLVGVANLNRRIFTDFKYDPRATTVATPLEEVLKNRRGVCQDFAHLAIASLRSLGLAARYVSGYLRTVPPPGKERLVGADASHAWFSVYCPDLGWVDFDPTNDVQPAQDHITVAVGRDFSDVSPLFGVITGGGSHDVTVSVDVEASVG
jgi:transglutaminase-like putative cysteine protease